MKRCAKCHSEYADDYDACPQCAKGDNLRTAGEGMRSCGCVLMLVPVLLIAVSFLFARLKL